MMNRFEVLKSITDIQKYSRLVYEMVVKTGTEEEFSKLLQKALNDEELQTLESIAQSDYPLFLEPVSTL